MRASCLCLARTPQIILDAGESDSAREERLMRQFPRRLSAKIGDGHCRIASLAPCGHFWYTDVALKDCLPCC